MLQVKKLGCKLLLPTIFFLPACGTVYYEGHSDGSTYARGISFGSVDTLSGFKASISPNGERKISIKDYSSDKVEGLEEINRGLSLIIEGLGKAAK